MTGDPSDDSVSQASKDSSLKPAKMHESRRPSGEERKEQAQEYLG